MIMQVIFKKVNFTGGENTFWSISNEKIYCVVCPNATKNTFLNIGFNVPYHPP